METSERTIVVSKTARYFILGSEKQPVKNILFVLHGYGMQAKQFVKEFKSILEPGTIVVAPEGLSRFYRKGFAGDVVATWMTKEDRLNEIADYIEYLDQLYHTLVNDSAIKVYVLGFSQGASTASRWVMKGNSEVHGLILWGGEFAGDIPEFNSSLKTIWQVIGFEDEFIPLAKFKEQSQYLESKGFIVKDFNFNAGHIIDELTLNNVWSEITNQP